MQHGNLLFILVGILAIVAGGVFLLVNQGSEIPVPQEESLVGGLGLVEEFTEEVYPPAGGNGGGTDENVIEIEQTLSSIEVSEESEQDSSQDIAEESSGKPESVEQGIEKNQIAECEIDAVAIPKQDTVILNEIAWMGTPHSSADEWIELKNISDSQVNLEGWQLFDKKKDIAIAFAKEHSIFPQGFFILERTDDTTLPNIIADAIYTGSLNNIDEALYLFDGACVLQDSVLARPEWPAGDSTERKSMERSQDLSWHTYEGMFTDGIFGTPNKENSIPTIQEDALPEEEQSTSPSSFKFKPYFPADGGEQEQTPPSEESEPVIYPKILISEIQVEGETAKDEFVELYNPNSTIVDLSGWALKRKTSSGSESNLVSSSGFAGTIAAQGYFLVVPQANDDGTPNYQGSVSQDLIYSGKTYSFAKNNTILLYDPNGDLVDKVGFGGAQDYEGAPVQSPGTGQSMGRTFVQGTYQDTDNNRDDFELQTPTPRAENRPAVPDQIEENLSSPPPPPPPDTTAPEESPSSEEPQPEADQPSAEAPSTGNCQQDQVDVNSASKEDLLLIKHIGDVRADELITLRPFSSLDDLTRIKGIGETRVVDIKEQGIACVN